MGEVVNVKKRKKYIVVTVITVIISLLITLPPVIQEKVQEKNDTEIEKQIAVQVLDALQHNGFSTSYIKEFNTGSPNIYINSNDDIHISYDNKFKLLDIDKLKNNTNIASILDTVLPIFDEKFEPGDGEIITKRLIDSRRYDAYEDELFSGSTSYHHIRYDEFLDETSSYTASISIWLK